MEYRNHSVSVPDWKGSFSGNYFHLLYADFFLFLGRLCRILQYDLPHTYNISTQSNTDGPVSLQSVMLDLMLSLAFMKSVIH